MVGRPGEAGREDMQMLLPGNRDMGAAGHRDEMETRQGASRHRDEMETRQGAAIPRDEMEMHLLT